MIRPERCRVRLATRDDVSATVSVLNRVFRTPVDDATWSWYLYGNPFGETRVYLAAADDGAPPSGVFAYTPVPLRISGESVMASSGHHLCVLPEARGGAAFIALSRAALKGESAHGVRLGLGIPNPKSHIAQKALLKWEDLCILDCLYKTSPSRRVHHCRETGRFDARFDEFYGRVQATLAFSIDKNQDWMNWRFFERPASPYTVYTTGDERHLAGYVVLKKWREQDGSTKAHIVDLHAMEDAALSDLVAAAESYAEDCQELNLWAAPGYSYQRHLEEQGFVARESARQPVIAKTLRGAHLAFPGAPASFSYADGDFVF